jgi:hypothetical protein
LLPCPGLDLDAGAGREDGGFGGGSLPQLVALDEPVLVGVQLVEVAL